MVFFFGLFALAGSFMFWWMVVRPLSGVVSAQSWTETPCTIVFSEVKTHADNDGATYSVDVRYDYTFGGQPYHGQRYHFMEGSSGGREGKQAVVDQYPVGRQTT